MNREIAHGIDLPDIHVEIFIIETILSKFILIHLKIFNIGKLFQIIIKTHTPVCYSFEKHGKCTSSAVLQEALES